MDCRRFFWLDNVDDFDFYLIDEGQIRRLSRVQKKIAINEKKVDLS